MPRRRSHSSSDVDSERASACVGSVGLSVSLSRQIPPSEAADDVLMRFIGVQLAGDSGLPSSDPWWSASTMARSTGLRSWPGSSLSFPSISPNGLG